MIWYPYFLKNFWWEFKSFLKSHSSSLIQVSKFFQLKWTNEHLITHLTMIWNTVFLKNYTNSDIYWILIRNSSKKPRIPYHCEMCDKTFILTPEKNLKTRLEFSSETLLEKRMPYHCKLKGFFVVFSDTNQETIPSGKKPPKKPNPNFGRYLQV